MQTEREKVMRERERGEGRERGREKREKERERREREGREREKKREEGGRGGEERRGLPRAFTIARVWAKNTLAVYKKIDLDIATRDSSFGAANAHLAKVELL
jgi:hypothetical protein